MTTLSIPVDDEINSQMQNLIKMGLANSISEIGRTAIKKHLDEVAVQIVLNAKEEPTLEGDLDELAEKL